MERDACFDLNTGARLHQFFNRVAVEIDKSREEICAVKIEVWHRGRLRVSAVAN
jgi:hypothetical protein